MRDHNQLQELLSQQLNNLNEDFGVTEIGIFGSYARGEQGPDSDLDVLVNFSRPIGFVTFMQLEQHLGRLLGIKVDLVTQAALKTHIGKRILKEVQYVH